jgi:glycosyltransferase involved in cell wall biosynthesis
MNDRIETIGLTHLETPETNAEGLFIRLKKELKPFTVVRIHGSIPFADSTNPLDALLLRFLQNFACRRGSRVLSPSHYSGNVYARQEIYWKGPIFRVPNPFLSPQLSPNPIFLNRNPFHLVFLGRLEYRKGLDVLLKALSFLDLQTHKWKITLIGSPPNLSNPENAPLQKQLDDALAMQLRGELPYHLEVLGQLPHTDAMLFLNQAGILCLPSRHENFSYSGLEGLSRGCFLLASDAGGNPELLEGGLIGEIFKSGDAEDLAKKMRKLQGDPLAVQKAWEENPKLMSTLFNPTQCLRDLEDSYAREEPKEPSRLFRL